MIHDIDETQDTHTNLLAPQRNTDAKDAEIRRLKEELRQKDAEIVQFRAAESQRARSLFEEGTLAAGHLVGLSPEKVLELFVEGGEVIDWFEERWQEFFTPNAVDFSRRVEASFLVMALEAIIQRRDIPELSITGWLNNSDQQAEDGIPNRHEEQEGDEPQDEDDTPKPKYERGSTPSYDAIVTGGLKKSAVTKETKEPSAPASPTNSQAPRRPSSTGGLARSCFSMWIHVINGRLTLMNPVKEEGLPQHWTTQKDFFKTQIEKIFDHIAVTELLDDEVVMCLKHDRWNQDLAKDGADDPDLWTWIRTLNSSTFWTDFAGSPIANNPGVGLKCRVGGEDFQKCLCGVAICMLGRMGDRYHLNTKMTRPAWNSTEILSRAKTLAFEICGLADKGDYTVQSFYINPEFLRVINEAEEEAARGYGRGGRGQRERKRFRNESYNSSATETNAYTNSFRGGFRGSSQGSFRGGARGGARGYSRGGLQGRGARGGN